MLVKSFADVSRKVINQVPLRDFSLRSKPPLRRIYPIRRFLSIRVCNSKEVFDILTVLAQYSNPTIHRGEFLAYGVLYAIGKDVGVGEVGNLLERLVVSATSQENRLVY